MNFDESQLSAFLDDELDATDHLMVAWNIESSSAVAQQLNELISVRNLVAGLDRPAIPVDLTTPVLAAIVPRNRDRRPAIARTGRLAATLIGLGSLAACLLFAVLMLHQILHDEATPPILTLQASTEPRTHLHLDPSAALSPRSQPESPQPTAASELAAKSSLVARSNIPSSTNAVPSDVPLAKAKEPLRSSKEQGSAEVTLDSMDAILGKSQVVRALIVTDVLDQTAQQVRTLIEHDAGRKPTFGRISLTRGIVIDPSQLADAEVFAVVMNRSHTQAFLDRLTSEFADLQVQPQIAPALVTDLSEAGRMEIFTDKEPRLGPPPHEIRALVATKRAVTSETLPPPNLDTHGFGGDALAAARQAQLPLEPVPQSSHPPARKPVDAGEALEPVSADEPVTVLVWVTRPPGK